MSYVDTPIQNVQFLINLDSLWFAIIFRYVHIYTFNNSYDGTISSIHIKFNLRISVMALVDIQLIQLGL